jgi:hypothetical protein
MGDNGHLNITSGWLTHRVESYGPNAGARAATATLKTPGIWRILSLSASRSDFAYSSL